MSVGGAAGSQMAPIQAASEVKYDETQIKTPLLNQQPDEKVAYSLGSSKAWVNPGCLSALKTLPDGRVVALSKDTASQKGTLTILTANDQNVVSIKSHPTAYADNLFIVEGKAACVGTVGDEIKAEYIDLETGKSIPSSYEEDSQQVDLLFLNDYVLIHLFKKEKSYGNVFYYFVIQNIKTDVLYKSMEFDSYLFTSNVIIFDRNQFAIGRTADIYLFQYDEEKNVVNQITEMGSRHTRQLIKLPNDRLMSFSRDRYYNNEERISIWDITTHKCLKSSVMNYGLDAGMELKFAELPDPNTVLYWRPDSPTVGILDVNTLMATPLYLKWQKIAKPTDKKSLSQSEWLYAVFPKTGQIVYAHDEVLGVFDLVHLRKGNFPFEIQLEGKPGLAVEPAFPTADDVVKRLNVLFTQLFHEGVVVDYPFFVAEGSMPSSVKFECQGERIECLVKNPLLSRKIKRLLDDMIGSASTFYYPHFEESNFYLYKATDFCELYEGLKNIEKFKQAFEEKRVFSSVKSATKPLDKKPEKSAWWVARISCEEFFQAAEQIDLGDNVQLLTCFIANAIEMDREHPDIKNSLEAAKEFVSMWAENPNVIVMFFEISMSSKINDADMRMLEKLIRTKTLVIERILSAYINNIHYTMTNPSWGTSKPVLESKQEDADKINSAAAAALSITHPPVISTNKGNGRNVDVITVRGKLIQVMNAEVDDPEVSKALHELRQLKF